MRMKIHERVTQLEERVARLEGQAQTQPNANTAEEIIRKQISLLVDVQKQAIAHNHYDTALQISVEIVNMATLAQPSVPR